VIKNEADKYFFAFCFFIPQIYSVSVNRGHKISKELQFITNDHNNEEKAKLAIEAKENAKNVPVMALIEEAATKLTKAKLKPAARKVSKATARKVSKATARKVSKATALKKSVKTKVNKTAVRKTEKDDKDDDKDDDKMMIKMMT